MNKEYRTRLEILLDFFKCASACKTIKTITVEDTSFFDDSELIMDLIEKELEEKPKGEWLGTWLDTEVAFCSKCHEHYNGQWLEDKKFNFCPNCGADMR